MIFIIIVIIIILAIVISSFTKTAENLDDPKQTSATMETPPKIPQQNTDIFSITGTDYENSNMLIQNIIKEYIKNDLIWGKYEELSAREIKYYFYSEDDPLWEISSSESFDVKLVYEPDNEFDSNAISIYTLDGKKLGYIPRKDTFKIFLTKDKITSIQAHIYGGKYKYVDCNDYGEEKIIVDKTDYFLKIWVTSTINYKNNENYIPIDSAPSVPTVPTLPTIPIKHSLTIPKYTKARKFDDSYVVIDFETTGLNLADSEIIQIGAIKYIDNVEVKRYSQYIRPIRSKISSTITSITGITESQLKNCPSFKDKAPEFVDFISEFTLVSHNAPFDMKFLLHQLTELQIELPKLRVFDTLPVSRRKLDFLKNNKLETIKQFLQIENQSHDALNDCITTAALYQYLKNRQ